MQDLWMKFINEITDPLLLARLWQAALIIIVGFLVTRLLILIVLKGRRKNLTPQSKMLIRKTISYTGLTFIVLFALNSLGINLAPLLGAAGILGIAIGFASQTSVSNIISGLFLIAEKPFEIGDVVTINANTGIVTSVDLLSIKIRGFDNRYIRVPNEQIIKSEVINITRFPIRRVDLNLRIAYKENLEEVRELLLKISRDIPECLENPEPVFLIGNFGERGVEFLFGVWIDKSNYIVVKNSLMMAIKDEFDKAGIELPYPHMHITMNPEGKSPKEKGPWLDL